MDNKLLIFSLLVFALVSNHASASTTTTSNFVTQYSALSAWLPVVFIGIILSMALIGIYYMIGYLFNNSGIKSAALYEYAKLVGLTTVVIVIIGVFYMFGSTLLFTGSATQTQITGVCNQLVNSKISFLSSNINSNSPANTVCSQIIDPSSNTGSVTRNLDYGLGATYIIEDNLTNQSVQSLNAVYVFNAMLGFLRNYKVSDAICFPVDCLIPDGPQAFSVGIQAAPYAGYQLGNTIPVILGLEAQLIFYFLLFQLVITILMLLIWPYLLAAGLILETNMFTRRLGGFLIAMVISSMLVYPTVFLFEYSSLNNIQNLQPYGASAIPNLALCGAPASGLSYSTLGVLTLLVKLPLTPQLTGNQNNGVYCYTSASQLPLGYIYKATLPESYSDMVPNAYANYPSNTLIPACPQKNNGMCFIKKSLSFYVFPKIKDTLALYFTWPQSGNILNFELPFILPSADIASSITNAVTQLENLLSGNFAGSFPTGLYYYVDPAHTIAALLALINIYAIDAVTGFILPIFNILILISSILEISKLLGGEASILGLSKFV